MIKELIESRSVRWGVAGLMGLGITVSSYRYSSNQDQITLYGIVPKISMQYPLPEHDDGFAAEQDFLSATSSLATAYSGSTSDVVLSGQTNSWEAQVRFSHPAL